MLFRSRKPVSPRQLAALAVSYCGVVLVFGHELGLGGPGLSWSTLWGALLVFGSAVSYSVYLLASGEVVPRLGSLRLTGLASSVACVLCLAHFALTRPLSDAAVPEPVLWLSLLNAVACTFAPVLMVMMAIERIGAALTAQTGMIGPMATITLGVLLLDEPLNVWIGLGTLLVLSGVYIVSKYGAK